MKKLKLTALSLGSTEVLTRDQMKNVFGGVNIPKCYQCCTPDGTICGSCDRTGNGACQGQGVATNCSCINV